MDFIIRAATTDDMPKICSIHLVCFQDYFLSNFGANFLNIYYRNYQSNPAHILLVAKYEGDIVGFISGTIDFQLLHQDLYKNNFISIAKVACKQFLINKNFRAQILGKKDYIAEAIKSSIERKRPTNKSNEIIRPDTQGCLMSLAVIGEFRGSGVALDLIREFEAEMKKRGVSACTLSVKRENLRGINFYKKAGWQISEETTEFFKFRKVLSENKLVEVKKLR